MIKNFCTCHQLILLADFGYNVNITEPLTICFQFLFCGGLQPGISLFWCMTEWSRVSTEWVFNILEII